MTLRPLAASLLIAIAGSVAIIWSLQSWAAARRASVAAHTELEAIAQRVAEIRAIGLEHPMPPAIKDGSLASRMSEVAAAVDIRRGLITSITPAPDTLTTIPESGFRAVQRRVTIEFTGISLPRLGAFLHEWAVREPAWRVAAIDLRPSGRHENQAGDHLPLVVTLAMECTSIEGESR